MMELTPTPTPTLTFKRRRALLVLPLSCLIIVISAAVPASASASASYESTSSATEYDHVNVDDHVNVNVPGCDCPVTFCHHTHHQEHEDEDEIEHEDEDERAVWKTNPFPCIYHDGSIYNIHVPLGLDSRPICDAIEQSLLTLEREDDRQQQHEHEHEQAHVAMFGGYGTCDDALSVQCHNVQSLDLRLSTMSVMDPLYCGGTFYPPPSSTLSSPSTLSSTSTSTSILTDTSLAIYMTCTAYRTRNMENNNLEVYIEVGDETDAYFSFQQDYDAIVCDHDHDGDDHDHDDGKKEESTSTLSTSISIPPALTSADWIIEPYENESNSNNNNNNNKGRTRTRTLTRRYMCHDLTRASIKEEEEEEEKFFILFLSIGNEPCSSSSILSHSGWGGWRSFWKTHRIMISLAAIIGIGMVIVYENRIYRINTDGDEGADADTNADADADANANANENR